MQHRVPRFARLLYILAGLAVAPALHAQYLDRGWTMEIGAGKTTFKDVTRADIDGLTRDFFNSFTLPVQTLNSTIDTSARSMSISAGYRFNRWLSAEAGMYFLGSFGYKSTGTVDDAGTLSPSTFDYRYRARSILLGGTATLPLGRSFELRARAGLSNSDVRVKYSATVGTDAVSDGFSDSSQDFYYGVGAGFVVWDYYRVGVDFLRHDKVGKASTTGSTSIDNVMLTIGFRY